mmetsp:Transcript_9106/g.20729  ORF Transcript_9106/g.20729 Transcript_9106/m.20729 type:complete len:556 (-) Transcript_9106:78-1745(-)
MGQSPSGAQEALDDVRERAQSRVGQIAISGRYHRLPKVIQDDYDIESKVLGTGYNGSVYRAKSKQTGQSYAVKGFHLLGVSKTKFVELQTEAEIFLTMDHPHVARLVGVYESAKHLNLVMECMEGGELFERVIKQKRFTVKDASHAVWQMLLAVNYLHSRGVVHRDLKLENFLYETKDGDHLKLIDFGFSHIWEPNTKMALSCGTLAYVAPEVLDKSYTSKCDLWSLGVIVFILLCGYMPFSGSEDFQINSIKMGRFVRKQEVWSKLPPHAQEFVRVLLTVDPEKRFSAEQALNHAFIADHDTSRPVSASVDASVVEALTAFHKATQFRRACLSVMAWSLTNEERAEVRDAFLLLDSSRQGTITLGELKQVLTTKFEITDEQIQSIFDSLDTSQNDEIHYSEFLAAMVSTRIAMHDDLLATTFKRFDVDNSGFITLDNLRTVLGETFDGSEVERLLEDVDISRDGKISWEEFISYMKNGEASDTHAEAAEKLIDSELVRSGGSKADVAEQDRGLTAKTKEACTLLFSKGFDADSPPAGSKDRPDEAAKSKACVLL